MAKVSVKYCPRCKTSKSLVEFTFNKKGLALSYCVPCFKEYHREKYYKDIEFSRSKRRNWNRKIKQEVINHYGGKCVCCNETKIEFLSFDHINNDGNVFRRTHHSRIDYWLRKNNYPKDIQVLCMNCNFAKGKYGYCPHKVC